MVKRWWGALALVTLVATGLTAIAAPAGAKPGKPAVPPAAAPLKGTPFEPGVVLVGYAPGAQAADVSAAHAALAATAVEPVSPLATDVEKITLGTGVTIEGARKALGAVKGIRFVEPNYLLAPTATSDDPYVVGGNLWGMAGNGTSPANTNGSQAAVAWSADRTGSRSVVVGIVDEGIQVNHPDLAANIWVNPGEVAGNGVDDDANGYVDDVNGYDFANNDGTVYDGAVGALGGNGVGVAGVNWSVTMISAKFLGAGGGTTANAIRAIDYLTDLKARYGLDLVATNNSWGGGGFSQALLDAIERGADRDIVFVAAAGNTAANNDTNPIYPASYRCTAGGTRGWDCVISGRRHHLERVAVELLELRGDHRRHRGSRVRDQLQLPGQRLCLAQRHLDGDSARLGRHRAVRRDQPRAHGPGAASRGGGQRAQHPLAQRPRGERRAPRRGRDGGRLPAGHRARGRRPDLAAGHGDLPHPGEPDLDRRGDR